MTLSALLKKFWLCSASMVVLFAAAVLSGLAALAQTGTGSIRGQALDPQHSQLGSIPDGYRRFHVVAAIKLLYLALEHIAKKWTKPVKDGRPPCNASRSYSATVFRKERGAKPGRPGWGAPTSIGSGSDLPARARGL